MLLTSTTEAANNLKFAKPSGPENFFRYHLVTYMLVDDKSLFRNTLYFCLEVAQSQGFQSWLPIIFSLINISKCKRNKLAFFSKKQSQMLIFCFAFFSQLFYFYFTERQLSLLPSSSPLLTRASCQNLHQGKRRCVAAVSYLCNQHRTSNVEISKFAIRPLLQSVELSLSILLFLIP